MSLDRPHSSPAQGGGLVKMPDTVAQVESQTMGSGFTVYFSVASIEDVGGFFSTLLLLIKI